MSALGLGLLSSVFGLGVKSRNALYDRGFFASRRLRGPVVSVGNLLVGGSGKTPFVIMLGHLLQEHDVKFDVLSRGYGRKTTGVAVVNPEGTAAEFGDEPLLMARRLRVPVIVGEQRYQAGLLAEQMFGPQLHILDDGFQHRALARDFDIVLLTPLDAEDRLLPRGRMREPFSSLRRADAVVLCGISADAFPLLGKQAWQVQRGIMPAHFPPNPVVFCGIARPPNFFHELRAAGVNPAAEKSYRDHHPYTERDVQELLALSRTHGAGGFITTEKDAINLGEHLPKLQPLTVVQVRMELQDAPNAVDTLLQAIAGRHR